MTIFDFYIKQNLAKCFSTLNRLCKLCVEVVTSIFDYYIRVLYFTIDWTDQGLHYTLGQTN